MLQMSKDQQATQDTEKRKQLLWEAQRRILDNAYLVVVNGNTQPELMWPAVMDYHQGGDSSDPLAWAYVWLNQ